MTYTAPKIRYGGKGSPKLPARLETIEQDIIQFAQKSRPESRIVAMETRFDYQNEPRYRTLYFDDGTFMTYGRSDNGVREVPKRSKGARGRWYDEGTEVSVKGVGPRYRQGIVVSLDLPNGMSTIEFSDGFQRAVKVVNLSA